MSKNVLIISSSPRAKGNSDSLCEEFANGARSAGHQVEKVFLKEHNIQYCSGCCYCVSHRGECTQKDAMQGLREKLKQADVIVLATPIYFYAMCGQLKTFIDRNGFFYTELTNKSFYYIMTAADTSTSAMDWAIGELRGYLSCLPGAREAGMLLATGVRDVGDITGKAQMQEAYVMGTNVGK